MPELPLTQSGLYIPEGHDDLIGELSDRLAELVPLVVVHPVSITNADLEVRSCVLVSALHGENTNTPVTHIIKDGADKLIGSGETSAFILIAGQHLWVIYENT